jgi:hypothetical protein
MRLTLSPNTEKNNRNIPQLMPSFRLLTSPACEAAKRLRRKPARDRPSLATDGFYRGHKSKTGLTTRSPSL